MSIYTKEEENFLALIGQIKKGAASAAPVTSPTTEATKAEDN
jgi:hypothetical protein